jgi:hypothetical protein
MSCTQAARSELVRIGRETVHLARNERWSAEIRRMEQSNHVCIGRGVSIE